MKVELGKNYRTRDGREVRIYAVDGWGEFPVHGAVMTVRGWNLLCWTIEGRRALYNQMPVVDDDIDLIECRPRIKREVWVNIHDSKEHPCSVAGYATRQDADEYNNRFNPRIACVKLTIDCEEGEGL